MTGAVCITGDTLHDMVDVTIRELRNEGGDVVDRAARGEQITITRSGRPVAELRALRIPTSPLSAEALIERWRRLPDIDPAALRKDVDEFLDWSL
jgi:antitoxin (DNA-binding transcriptional repressor) of toxin-antitoxin stability system